MQNTSDARFLGFHRSDGTAGVRNYVAVIPSVFCANAVAQQVAEPFECAVALCHSLGCSHVGQQLKTGIRTLKGLGQHPNVGAVLIVGPESERRTSSELAEAIAASGKPVETVLIRQEGDDVPAIEEGRALVARFEEFLEAQARVECGVEHLTVAVVCEGSDPCSLQFANPSIGVAMDMVVDHLGTAVFSEVDELFDAEDALLQRLSTTQVAEAKRVLAQARNRLHGTVHGATDKRRTAASGAGVARDFPTAAEMSLGSLAKAGSRPIAGVVEYGMAIPRSAGVFLMNGPANHAEAVTGMVAGGAQVVVFATSHGTRAQSPVAPVISTTGNPGIYHLFQENIDVNAGAIAQSRANSGEVGQQLFQAILEVATGRPTKSELSTQREPLAVWQGL